MTADQSISCVQTQIVQFNSELKMVVGLILQTHIHNADFCVMKKKQQQKKTHIHVYTNTQSMSLSLSFSLSLGLSVVLYNIHIVSERRAYAYHIGIWIYNTQHTLWDSWKQSETENKSMNTSRRIERDREAQMLKQKLKFILRDINRGSWRYTVHVSQKETETHWIDSAVRLLSVTHERCVCL